MVFLKALALLLVCVGPGALAQDVAPPVLLGSIAGPGSVVDPAGVRFYGTDLGWTFEHRGQHFMLFGDTWPHSRSMCDPLPHNDDSQATLALRAAGGTAAAHTSTPIRMRRASSRASGSSATASRR